MDKILEDLDYLRNWAVIAFCAVIWLLAVLVMAPVYLIQWIGRHILWIVTAVAGVMLIAWWFWRCCTEPLG